MTEYAIFMYAPASDVADPSPSPEATRPYDQHSEELQSSGSMLAAFALERSSTGRSLRPGGLVTDGPFAETKEVIAGLYVIEAADLDAAVAVAERNPILNDGGRVEIRAVSGTFIRRD